MDIPQLLSKDTDLYLSNDKDKLNPNKQLNEPLSEEKSQEVIVKAKQDKARLEGDDILQVENHNKNTDENNIHDDKNLTIHSSSPPIVDDEEKQKSHKSCSKKQEEENSKKDSNSAINQSNEEQNNNEHIQNEVKNNSLSVTQVGSSADRILREYIQRISFKPLLSIIDQNIEASARWSQYLFQQNQQYQNQIQHMMSRQQQHLDSFYSNMHPSNPFEEQKLIKKYKISIGENENQEKDKTNQNEESEEEEDEIEVEQESDSNQQKDQIKEPQKENHVSNEDNDKNKEIKKNEDNINSEEKNMNKEQQNSIKPLENGMESENTKKQDNGEEKEISGEYIKNKQEQIENSKENDSKTINKLASGSSKEPDQSIEMKKNRKQSQSSSNEIMEIGNQDFDKTIQKTSNKKQKQLDKEQDRLLKAQNESLNGKYNAFQEFQEYKNHQNLNSAHQPLMFPHLFGNQNPYLHHHPSAQIPSNSQIPPYLDAPQHPSHLDYQNQYNPYNIPFLDHPPQHPQQNNSSWSQLYPSLGQGQYPPHHPPGMSGMPQLPPLLLQALNQQRMNQARDHLIDNHLHHHIN